jgi:hypothetical protein
MKAKTAVHMKRQWPNCSINLFKSYGWNSEKNIYISNKQLTNRPSIEYTTISNWNVEMKQIIKITIDTPV